MLEADQTVGPVVLDPLNEAKAMALDFQRCGRPKLMPQMCHYSLAINWNVDVEIG